MQCTVAQIIAHALVGAGADVVTHVPGFGGTEVFEALCMISGRKHHLSFHEEVAYSIAHGAGIVGSRSATLIKAHGLVKAANGVVDSLSAGTTGGFVIIVFDDKLGGHSESIFNIEDVVHGLGIPYRVPSIQNIYREVLEAFSLSQERQLPFVLLIDTAFVDQLQAYTPVPVEVPSSEYLRDVNQHVVCPVLAQNQHRILEAKLFGEDWRILSRPVLPVIPDDLPGTYQSAVQSYMPLFEVFRTLRGRIVTGDTSTSTLFALPPFDCVDICTYMGGSIPLAIGAYLAGYHDTWALTGDFSFIAAGHLGLLEAIQREIPLKVLIFHNGKAEATGGQTIPGSAMEHVLKGYEKYTSHISNPRDTVNVKEVLKEAKEAEKMRIVMAEYNE
jgi:TPP-dependent indolepyruvate ferredoxin oxidoreductase alpha subunit